MTFRLSIVVLLFVVFLIGGDWLSAIILDSAGYSQLFYIAFGTLLLRYDYYTSFNYFEI